MSLSNKQLQLTVTKVDELVFSGAVTEVLLPGVEGDMVVLADHEPFISPLRAGQVEYVLADQTRQAVEIKAGMFEFASNQATVLVQA